MLSRLIQLLAVVLTALGGIIPIFAELTHNTRLASGLWASFFVGIAAALLGLDRAFGFSTGWARYVLAATNIRRVLEDFRLDWLSMIASAGAKPTPDQIEALIKRAREFRVAVEAIVLQETKDWVTEFQSNMAQLETDVRAQLASLKAETEKAEQARKAETQTGSVEITITNAEKSDGGKVHLKLDGAEEPIADEIITGTKTFACTNIAPGHYRLTISGSIGGKTVSSAAVVIVKPGENSKTEISLPV